jgi:hypothetical protein
MDALAGAGKNRVAAGEDQIFQITAAFISYSAVPAKT